MWLLAGGSVVSERFLHEVTDMEIYVRAEKLQFGIENFPRKDVTNLYELRQHVDYPPGAFTWQGEREEVLKQIAHDIELAIVNQIARLAKDD